MTSVAPMHPWRQGLMAAHVIAGIAVVALLCRHLGDRAQEVNVVRTAARSEHEVPERMRRDNARVAELIGGVERQDPYVIELLTREKLQYGRPGEITPPPAPQEPTTKAAAIDRQDAGSTK